MAPRAPFTAFGQFGEDALDLRVFDQGTNWVDRVGRPHFLAEMDEDYIANVIDFLIALRDQCFDGTQRRWFLQSLATSSCSVNRPGTSWLPRSGPGVVRVDGRGVARVDAAHARCGDGSASWPRGRRTPRSRPGPANPCGCGMPRCRWSRQDCPHDDT